MTTPDTAAPPRLITTELVRLDADLGSRKEDVIAALAETVAATGRATSAEGLQRDAMAREAQSATGLPGGIAIPHCRSEAVTTATLAFARLAPKVDFGAPDGGADLAFLIAAPASGGQEHLKLLTALARALVKPAFTTALREAKTPQEIVDLVTDVVTPKPAAAPAAGATTGTATGTTTSAAPAAAGAASTSGSSSAAGKVVVAVTACPTGIAHTYMAADSLVAAAERAGITLKVETQGSGATTPLPASLIASADAVIFATDVPVKGRERFAGKPVIASGVKRAINEPDVMVAEALKAATDPSAARVAGDGGGASASTAVQGGDVSFWVKVRQVLLTGVSYMIPFVAAGGLLIALGFLLAGYRVTNLPSGADSILLNNSLWNLPDVASLKAAEPLLQGDGLRDSALLVYLGAMLFQIGALAFSFLVPALAGYISFGIADRPGIAPGFTAGAVAVFTGAGFLGGLVGGVLAGLVAYAFSRLDVPKWLRGLMPVMIIPLVASIVAGGLMFLFLGRPLAAATNGLSSWLSGLTGTSAILLGVILGLMMCFDLGGPVNKAAYAFATAGLSVSNPGSMQVMAAVMAAGMVPPLAMALATAVRPKLFSAVEQENGKAAWLLGFSFISEGAIPFAAADPLRIIPASMAGGAVTGALIMAFQVQLSAPHGGLFVFFAMNNFVLFIAALVVGFVISAALVIVLKSTAKRPVAA
ncbi:PTS system D-fructose-specific IIA component (F1P-forming), Frc family /PTS system D-fructose-specific IIB component (F1P-forming), Frc family /PTS system D-fructose-specific IIC component (F1P-forming), Frc family [Quadrisphaera granulorum]|uniref:PTS system D-fructose-specific IIA component (F1P-forming) (Frc family) /PTS system D-fructose-specific IIB component (F1P-forming) (Frc family) /PTS system D-fructose-specific IIC component (F1P-f... n=1 Tax=Quadrisphaera granulorum TaxID=317664 RepID=A0A316AJS3_9ACTN|nr:fructose-specific PTS transporter subunit EIIC [Quadrisphaera granulorum]PWJ50217.1 PTS system D-fructose-specific IIA component (F1P-forming) (Frc family) /PTS system D-fructose-specific IIB component (F1P-forming) (Frc family) /PTS system D-fructose-specific IIC component (F1P-forming) (Frc family) [Quadrisphaera granulorum]SZE97983.1 PTS system D-fructose-specific IIA component (F1P-forming), Frc family /PTS system D-fructose-specific IIB component (F1P-forming), Frc family /PTS system D-fr